MSLNMDYSSLNWVKGEIDETLKQARIALEAFAENPDDEAQLRFCVTYLHQVYGTLQMVELYGAALVAEEMERVVNALLENKITRKQEIYETLMLAMLQLPDYLERIQGGQKDIPIALLPLLNDLRAIRGGKLLTEGALFSPDLSRAPSALLGDDSRAADDISTLAKQNRHGYQLSLLGWYKDNDVEHNLKTLSEIINKIRAAATQEPIARLMWIAEGLVDALLQKGLDASISVKLLLGHLDREIKKLIDNGEDGLLRESPDVLVKNMLYYIAHSGTQSGTSSEIRNVLELDKVIPDEADIDKARQNLTGLNIDVLETVHSAVKEDLTDVKDQLDLFVRSGSQDTGGLEPLLDKLKKIADTLGMLGLGIQRQKIEAQAGLLDDMIHAFKTIDAAALMDIAGTLLYVESILGDAKSVARRSIATKGEDIETESGKHGVVPDSEYKKVQRKVIKETKVDMAKVKDAIVDYIESPWHVDLLSSVSELNDEIRGSMRMLELDRASRLLGDCNQYILEELIENKNVPSQDSLNSLADIIISLEYYLEAVDEERGDREHILDIADEALDRLKQAGHEFVGSALQQETVAAVEAGAAADEAEMPVAESVTSEGEQPVLADKPGLQATRPEPSTLVGQQQFSTVPDEEIDDEIKEIFLEEAAEELSSLQQFVPQWKDNLENEDALSSIRRSFHTLKGSGRMVGATYIGEFAWCYENMLNRVIDGTVRPSAEMIEIMEQAITVLPGMIEQFNAGTSAGVETQALMDRADALSGRVKHEAPHLVQNLEAAAGPPQAPDEEAAVEQIQLASEDETVAGQETERFIDPALLEIFKSESVGHIETIKQFTQSCRRNIDDCELSEALIRAVHTLHGSAHMADITDVAEICSVLEKYTRLLSDNRLPVTEIALNQIDHCMMIIEGFIGKLESHSDKIESKGELLEIITRLHQLAEIEVEQHSSNDEDQLPFITEGVVGLDFDAEAPVEDEAVVEPEHAERASAAPEAIEEPATDEIEITALPDENAGEMTFDFAADESMSLADAFAEDAEQPPEELALEPEAEDNMPQAEAAQPQQPEQPAATTADEAFDAELVEIFLEEGDEILDASETTLQQWVNDQGDTELVKQLQRELHTLKGGARMANLPAIGDLSHSLESMIIAVTEERVTVTPALFTLMQLSHDKLTRMIDEVRRGMAATPEDELIAEIDALVRSGGLVGEKAATEEPAAAREISEGTEEIAEPEAPVLTLVESHEASPAAVAETAAPSAEEAVPEVEAPAARLAPGKMSQEQVRVRADLLDNLVNFAGEVSIYRSRIEQEVGVFKYNLTEMDQTIDRLREQLRKFEIETEAQIMYRFEESGNQYDEDFDPLEMDRFSNMQQLSRSLMESVGDLQSIQGLLEGHSRETETLLLQQSRVNTELQEGLMRTRMVPFSIQLPRLRRIVRQTCNELNKQADLVVTGENDEMDRRVLERVIPSLEHMLRNAIDHGIESPARRESAGKPANGTVRLSVRTEGSEVVIRLRDDGAGINLDAIRDKARNLGMMKADADLTDKEVLQFILEAGFSTAERITQISGRGVGMDVVNSEIKQLGGSLYIDTEQGHGSTFTIRLPLTLSVNQALLVHVGDENYAIPLASIQAVVRIDHKNLADLYHGKAETYSYGGQDYRFMHLGSILGTNSPQLPGKGKKLPAMLVRAGDHRVAIQVENLLGSREIVVKSVGPQISTIRGISGATILGDGSVALILDLGAVVLMDVARHTNVVEETEAVIAATAGKAKSLDEVTVMVVDDSITVRRVTSRLLERNNMSVITAKDGVDAVATLHEQVPDIFLLDIEMPRMDGYELAQHIRNNERLKDIPIIMITSRTGEKHRQRALDIGVDQYLGKPYQEADLVNNIKTLLNLAD